MSLSLGSLFDGSGGFPLAGMLADIVPKWNSEIEPFPIRVTTKRLPHVKHYGDTSTLNGAELEPVDIITFGSPCTNISVAGKREGLHGEQSGLFFQAIRVIKEMREKTNGNYPRFIVWENVRGALSSNDGRDFRDVLETIARTKDGEVSIPKPKRWLKAGECVGRDFSIAWRVLDAQYFGVPQRRPRIFLVADFAGQCAREILFESTSGTGDTEKSNVAGQGDSAETQGSTRERSGTSLVLENHGQGSRYRGPLEIAPTLAAHLGTGGNNQPLVVETTYSIGHDKRAATYTPEKADPLAATDYKDPPVVNQRSRARYLTPLECGRLQGFPDDWCADLETAEPTDEDLTFWREVFEMHRKATGSSSKPKSDKAIIKWLKNPHTNSAEYKMWGNGVALPCVHYILSRLNAVASMAKYQ